MSSGKIVQIIGAVIDVEFPRDAMPKVYDALNVTDAGLTLEVQQQLGDGVVRTIAMGSTDGLKRGRGVAGTGAPIQVPVGVKTLGRIMVVLGRPIDEAGPIGEEDRWFFFCLVLFFVVFLFFFVLFVSGFLVFVLFCSF